MKLYIASASALPHLDTVEHFIRAITLGKKHEITYDWTRAVRNAGHGSPDDMSVRLAAVVQDLAGVRAADLVWLLAPPADSKSTGAWVELGYALASAVPVITSGDVKRCIFADIAIKQFVTHDEAFMWLQGLPS